MEWKSLRKIGMKFIGGRGAAAHNPLNWKGRGSPSINKEKQFQSISSILSFLNWWIDGLFAFFVEELTALPLGAPLHSFIQQQAAPIKFIEFHFISFNFIWFGLLLHEFHSVHLLLLPREMFSFQRNFISLHFFSIQYIPLGPKGRQLSSFQSTFPFSKRKLKKWRSWMANGQFASSLSFQQIQSN